MFGFCFFSGSGKFYGSGDFGYLFFQRGALVEETGSASDDLVEGVVHISACQELGFFLPFIVLEESGVGDGVDTGVSRGLIDGLLEMKVMAGGVSSVGKVEVLGLVKGFIDGQGSSVPIDGWVDVFKPGKS